MSPRWGLGNWFICVLYTYRPSGALEVGQDARPAGVMCFNTYIALPR